jgi:hypothetical protein
MNKILPTNLFVTETLRPSADRWRVAIKFNWNETTWIVGTDWTKNNESFGFIYLAKTESIIHANRCRSNIQRVKRASRNPFFFNFHKFLKTLNHLFGRELRESKLPMRCVHSFEVLIRTEEHNSIVVGDICFQSFEALNAIVQSSIRGIKLERLVSSDYRALPPTIVRIVVNLQHVVSWNTSECVLMVLTWLGLEVFALIELQISLLK